jgi:thiamine-phosphate pyrophosphorylase
MAEIKDCSLYLVISEEYSAGKSAMEIAKLAILGEVDIIQMREKNKARGELVKLAYELSRLCKEKRVIFIVNDDPWIAKECDADGVHLGQEDMLKYDINKARDILGKGKIIGVSTHSLDQLNNANEKDIDYIAYGPIFPTKTKDYFIGAKDIKEVLRIARKPVFFIGGINLSNLGEILEQGAKNIAIISGIIQAEDISARTRNFKDRLRVKTEGA